MGAGYDGEIRIDTKIDTKNLSSQMATLENKIVKSVNKARDLNAELEQMRKLKIPTEDFAANQKQIEQCTAKLNALNDRMEKYISLGKDTSSNSFKSMQYDAEQLKKTIASIRGDQQWLKESGKAYVDPTTTVSYQKKAEQLRDVNAQTAILIKKQDELARKEQKTGEVGAKSLKKVGDSAKSTSGKLSGLTKMIGRMLVSMLLFQVVYKLFEYLKSGIDNLAKGNEKFNSSMSQLASSAETLKNSLATAFAPIITAITPAIVKLCDWITTAINKINQLVAALTGKSTWLRATKQQKDYAASLDKTSKAAKSASGSLQSFNELNVINPNASSSGENGTDASSMFEEVPVSSKFIDKLKPFLNYLKKMKDEVKKGWKDTWKDLNMDAQIADIKKNAASIKSSLIDIFTDPNVLKAADNYVMTAMYSLGQIGASITSVGLTIGQNLLGGLSKYLDSNKDRIKKYIINILDVSADIMALAGTLAEAFANVFQVLGSDSGQQITANLIQIFADVQGTIAELTLELSDDVLHLLLDPFIDNQEEFKTALQGIVDVVAEVTGTLAELVRQIADGINDFYDNHVHPFFQNLTEGISEIVAVFLDFWNTYMQPILEKAAALIEDTYQSHLKPFVDKVLVIIGQLIDRLNILWTKYLQPLIKWVTENILPVIGPILSVLLDLVSIAVNGMIDGAERILTVVSDVLNVIIDILNGDWAKAWTDAGTVVKDIANGIIDTAEGMVNGIIKGINSIIRELNKLDIKVPDGVPGIGGKEFKFSISTLKEVDLPKLANGGIAISATQAEIGEAGKEAVLPLENNLEYLDGFADRLASKINSNTTFKVEGDPNGLFKVVRQEAHDYFNRTGKPAFDY